MNFKFINKFFKGLLLILFICTSVQGFAQEKKVAKKSIFKLENLSLKLEYFGDMIRHPGAAIGVDYALFKNSWFALHWDTDIGFYVHRWNHAAAFLKTSVGTRYTTNDGVLFDFNIGAGYLHSFPEGDVYKRNSAGQLEKVASGGYAHLMPFTSFIFGWDASKRTKLPLSVYFGPECFMEYPFNHGILPHLALKVGVIYQLNKKNNE